MGTSKGLDTPVGGDWKAVKRDITSALKGTSAVNPNSIIGGVVGAAGGLGV